MQNKFGTKLKEIRKIKGVNQTELARVLTVTKQTVSAWENNLQETDFNMLIAIARYFDVTTDYLLGLEN